MLRNKTLRQRMQPMINTYHRMPTKLFNRRSQSEGPQLWSMTELKVRLHKLLQLHACMHAWASHIQNPSCTAAGTTAQRRMASRRYNNTNGTYLSFYSFQDGSLDHVLRHQLGDFDGELRTRMPTEFSKSKSSSFP